MTDLSTLLHAAARGARLQKYDPFDWKWKNVELWKALWYIELNYLVRIHPSDEHLMWGPLSRQYYEAALFGAAGNLADEVKTDLLSFGCMRFDDWAEHYREADEPTRRMILLTIALALRDEGM